MTVKVFIMIGSVLFFFYLAMCFTGLLGLILIQTLMRHGSKQGESLLRAGRSFMMADLLVGLFYFSTYYREMVLGQFHSGPVLRGIDGVQFYVIALAWLSLVYAAACGPEDDSARWRKASKAIFPVLMACSLAAYLFLVDGYYQPVYVQSQPMLQVVETVLSLSVIVFTVFGVRYCFARLESRFERRYILIVSILINFNNIWNSVIVMITLRQRLGDSLLSSYMYALTALVLLAVNVLTILFFYQRDFSPIFYAKAGQPLQEEGPVTEEQAMDALAAEKGLTQREREVMGLAYQGLTNPEIAEALTISRYTVKRHMHNLFEKLQIQGRMELVHLVGQYKK